VAAPDAAPRRVAVGYSSPHALSAVLARHPGLVLKRLPPLGVAEVQPDAADFARKVRALRGIRFVEQLRPRRSQVDPALFLASAVGAPYEWQFQATHADTVPASVLRAASAVTIAIVDSGADLSAPDIAAKRPHAYNAVTRTTGVLDTAGHGTFVASLAAGSVTNN
jgi:subtilisin family serine protease